MKVLALVVLLALGLGGTAAAAEPLFCSTETVAGPASPPDAAVYLELHGSVDAASVAKLVGELKTAQATKRPVVLLEINSDGGTVYPGFDVVRQIEKMKDTKVVCIADIQAQSMAFVILQSCGQRIMTKRTMLMTHEPYLGGTPSLATQIKLHNMLSDIKATARGFNEYVSHQMKMPYDKYFAHVHDGRDWHFSHIEALKYNAVDEVVDSVNEVLARYAQ